jgi:hypothetical protein
MRQQGVLLRLVESVDLVHEENRLLAVEALLLLGGCDHFAKLWNPSEHGAERNEDRVRLVRDHVC